MKIAAITAAIILFPILILLIVLSQHGLFAPVKIAEKDTGPYLLVYKKHTGEYKNVGPVMDALYYDLKDKHEIETTKGFGIYYDNPRKVDKDKLRSIVGCIVENKTIEDLSHLTEDYGVKEYPSSKSLVAQFPYSGKISIIIGVFKVYPKLSAFIEQKKYPQTPIMEIYDQPNKTIEYIAPVNLQQEVFDNLIE